MGCMAFLEGALKYGRSNFRVVGVRASIYKDALDRHMNAWFEGEDIDPESGLPHLGKALACIAIIVDAQACGQLNDDRMVGGGYQKVVADLTPHVARLKTQHANLAPKHFTIADNIQEPLATELRAQAERSVVRIKDWAQAKWVDTPNAERYNHRACTCDSTGTCSYCTEKGLK